MKKTKDIPTPSRVLGRRLARELKTEDLEEAKGGAATISYVAGGHPGDIDEASH